MTLYPRVKLPCTQRLNDKFGFVGKVMLQGKKPLHPELAENIAPDGGPGSDITWIKIIIQTNCLGARWFFKPVQDGGPLKIQQWCHFLGPHQVQYSLLTRGENVMGLVKKKLNLQGQQTFNQVWLYIQEFCGSPNMQNQLLIHIPGFSTITCNRIPYDLFVMQWQYLTNDIHTPFRQMSYKSLSLGIFVKFIQKSSKNAYVMYMYLRIAPLLLHHNTHEIYIPRNRNQININLTHSQKKSWNYVDLPHCYIQVLAD